jgi:hypothetical protein
MLHLTVVYHLQFYVDKFYREALLKTLLNAEFDHFLEITLDECKLISGVQRD